MTNRETFIQIATALYGARWQHAVARDMGLHVRQVHRWASGQYDPSADHVAALRALAIDRVRLILNATKNAPP